MATARLTDPETSWMAARSLKAERISETQRVILGILQTAPSTDEDIIYIYKKGATQGLWKPASDSGIRSRRAELVTRGLVHKVGIGTNEFGNKMTIWEAINALK